ncbi:MAG TPA: hypothetical protein VGX03_17855 [Candidatus Binatia bacterium]|jgi:hypothetical protein|nr:hypothetical protein [Candidatus Binatia bacterium]
MTKPRAPAENSEDHSPSLYILRVNRRTREDIPGPIDPDELLIHTHRDLHPLEVAAQFLASRTIQLTGAENPRRSCCRSGVKRGGHGKNTHFA